MGFFSRSSTGSSTTTTNRTSSQAQRSQGSKIETVITERSDQPYAADPQDMDAPAFTRTGSYYHTSSELKQGYEYLQASDVRRQVQEAPSHRPTRGYPKTFHNLGQPGLELDAQRPYTEYPIVPSPQNGSRPGNYRNGPPGPVRAIYNDNDRAVFDVGYHDQSRPPVGPRDGKPHIRAPFSQASYHPAPTYTDTATYRRS